MGKSFMRSRVITWRHLRKSPQQLHTAHLNPQILHYSLPTLFNLRWPSSFKLLKLVKRNNYFENLPLMPYNVETGNLDKHSTIFHSIKLNIAHFKKIVQILTDFGVSLLTHMSTQY